MIQPHRAPHIRPFLWLRAALLLVALALPASAGAQNADTVAQELRKIHRSIDRLAAALEGDAEQRRTTLLLQRAQLEAVGLAPLEGELRSARHSLETLRQQVAPGDTALQDVERRLFEAETDEQQRQLRMEREQLRLMLENYERQVATQEASVFEMESDLDRRRALFEALTAEIDRSLGIQ